MRNFFFGTVFSITALALVACSHAALGGSALGPPTGTAGRFAVPADVLHSFGKGRDGALPESELIFVRGTFYGTTSGGGSYKAGTVFSIDAHGVEKVLHNFVGGRDGAGPAGGLIFASGKLYGITESGGSGGFGTVFSITPGGEKKVVYNFAGQPNDGAGPTTGLTYLDGNLYGTTLYGGAYQNLGTIFRLSPSGKETLLHQFGGTGTDGNMPSAKLVAVNGTLYGTTTFAGIDQGTLFKILPSGGGYKILHQFDDEGSRPTGLIYENGNLYGITAGGPDETGTFYSATLGGHVTALYQFGSNGGVDVTNPFGSIVYANGFFYFTGANGGSANAGGVVKITAAGKERVLYSFGSGGPGDGSGPAAGPMFHQGFLYGTTREGGANLYNGFGGGTVYKLRP